MIWEKERDQMLPQEFRPKQLKFDGVVINMLFTWQWESNILLVAQIFCICKSQCLIILRLGKSLWEMLLFPIAFLFFLSRTVYEQWNSAGFEREWDPARDQPIPTYTCVHAPSCHVPWQGAYTGSVTTFFYLQNQHSRQREQLGQGLSKSGYWLDCKRNVFHLS